MTISSWPWDDGSIKARSCGRRFRRTQTTMLAVIRLHSFSPGLTSLLQSDRLIQVSQSRTLITASAKA